jgi:alkanesulfonate monooxygenase SsuD/methylene tetrahydromethanopterin reductase-like flavin-dependent oxidoreductase (luciferase family)
LNWRGLGLGRAPGGDGYTMRALRRSLRQTGDDFPELLEELRTYLGPGRTGQMVHAYPGQSSNVPVTLLGSSAYSAQLAARLGLAFAFAAQLCARLPSSCIGALPASISTAR